MIKEWGNGFKIIKFNYYCLGWERDKGREENGLKKMEFNHYCLGWERDRKRREGI